MELTGRQKDRVCVGLGEVNVFLGARCGVVVCVCVCVCGVCGVCVRAWCVCVACVACVCGVCVVCVGLGEVNVFLP